MPVFPVKRTCVEHGTVDLDLTLAALTGWLQVHAAEVVLADRSVQRISVVYDPKPDSLATLSIAPRPPVLRETNAYRRYVEGWLAAVPPQPESTLLSYAEWTEQERLKQLIEAVRSDPEPFARLAIELKLDEAKSLIAQGDDAVLRWLGTDRGRFQRAVAEMEARKGD